MSKQVICDLCGSRIGDFREAWRLSMFQSQGIRGLKDWQQDCSLNYEDICQNCAKKIYQHVISIKNS